MRLTTLVVALGFLVLGSLAVGAHTLARGEDDADQADAAKADAAEADAAKAGAARSATAALEEKVDALEAQVAYLLSREADMTAYVLVNEQRGQALQKMVALMQAQGFQNRSIPAESRETLLIGLDALGKALQEGLPKLTKAQTAMAREAKRVR